MSKIDRLQNHLLDIAHEDGNIGIDIDAIERANYGGQLAIIRRLKDDRKRKFSGEIEQKLDNLMYTEIAKVGGRPMPDAEKVRGTVSLLMLLAGYWSNSTPCDAKMYAMREKVLDIAADCLHNEHLDDDNTKLQDELKKQKLEAKTAAANAATDRRDDVDAERRQCAEAAEQSRLAAAEQSRLAAAEQVRLAEAEMLAREEATRVAAEQAARLAAAEENASTLAAVVEQATQAAAEQAARLAAAEENASTLAAVVEQARVKATTESLKLEACHSSLNKCNDTRKRVMDEYGKRILDLTNRYSAHSKEIKTNYEKHLEALKKELVSKEQTSKTVEDLKKENRACKDQELILTNKYNQYKTVLESSFEKQKSDLHSKLQNLTREFDDIKKDLDAKEKKLERYSLIWTTETQEAKRRAEEAGAEAKEAKRQAEEAGAEAKEAKRQAEEAGAEAKKIIDAAKAAAAEVGDQKCSARIKELLEQKLEQANNEKKNAIEEKKKAIEEKKKAIEEKKKAIEEKKKADNEKNLAIKEKKNAIEEKKNAIEEKKNAIDGLKILHHKSDNQHKSYIRKKNEFDDAIIKIDEYEAYYNNLDHEYKTFISNVELKYAALYDKTIDGVVKNLMAFNSRAVMDDIDTSDEDEDEEGEGEGDEDEDEEGAPSDLYEYRKSYIPNGVQFAEFATSSLKPYMRPMRPMLPMLPRLRGSPQILTLVRKGLRRGGQDSVIKFSNPLLKCILVVVIIALILIFFLCFVKKFLYRSPKISCQQLPEKLFEYRNL